MTAFVATGALAVYAASLLWAMLSDAVRFEIPNAAPILMCAAYALACAATGPPWSSVAAHLAAAAGVLAVAAGLFVAGLLGGGDVKLLAACSLWIGPVRLPGFLLEMALLGGLLALLLLAFRRLPRGRGGPAWLRRLHERRSDVPYGLAIGGAGLLMLPQLAQGPGMP